MTVHVDRDALAATLRAETGRLAAMLDAAPDLEAPVPGLDWRVHDVAAHLFTVYGVFGAAIAGVDTASLFADTPDRDTVPGRVAEVNRAAIAHISFDSPAHAATMLSEAAARLVTALEGVDDVDARRAAPWYGTDTTHRIATIASLAGTETLVHGRDIALALHARRPGVRHAVTPASAALVTPVVMTEMLPYMVDIRAAAGVQVRYEVRLRGAASFAVRVAEGIATTGPVVPGEADCVLSITPVAALLTGFGRLPVWRAIAAGQSIAYGRRPWLGPRFPRLFLRP